MAKENIRPALIAVPSARIRKNPSIDFPGGHTVTRSQNFTSVLQGLLMCCETRTRFRSAEESLRFYFRLRELLHRGRTSRLLPGELPADASAVAANAIDDFRCVGWSMRGLDKIALWLLSEIYGPTGFGVRRRTFSQTCNAGRREFPGHRFRRREVGMIHERALGVIKRGLRRLNMIPPGRPKPVHEHYGRDRTLTTRPALLHAGRAANRG